AAPHARELLDCSCGIGTQAIGLARRGYRVLGTDISLRSLQRARTEADRLGAEVDFAQADFRDLEAIAGRFDVVISCDNAIPHLLDEEEVCVALSAMRSRLRPGGLLLLSTRDYDQALIDRPAAAPPLLVPGPPRRVVVRLHDWDGPDSRLHTVRFLILTEEDGGWTVAHHSARYRAITAGELGDAAARAGFVDITWMTAAAVGLHQPVMTAISPAA
ncbi:MAG: type 11 methyltransferase, partial [Solirubrobacterales bacterium]|nr:type 11 methyltransferase [Solirubrobacterales bacterium]